MEGGDNLKSGWRSQGSFIEKAESEQKLGKGVNHVDGYLGEEDSRKRVEPMAMSGAGKQG